MGTGHKKAVCKRANKRRAGNPTHFHQSLTLLTQIFYIQSIRKRGVHHSEITSPVMQCITIQRN